MVRHTGTKNARYADRRKELVARLRERLEERRGDVPPSWRGVVAAAGVSLSTLTHYFGKRTDVVRAVMEHDLASGAGPLA